MLQYILIYPQKWLPVSGCMISFCFSFKSMTNCDSKVLAILRLHISSNLTLNSCPQKQINIHNKVVKHVMDLVNTAREEWETETAGRTSQPQTCSLNETQALVAALGTGKGFKMRAQPPGPSPTIQQPPPQSKNPSGAEISVTQVLSHMFLLYAVILTDFSYLTLGIASERAADVSSGIRYQHLSILSVFSRGRLPLCCFCYCENKIYILVELWQNRNDVI